MSITRSQKSLSTSNLHACDRNSDQDRIRENTNNIVSTSNIHIKKTDNNYILGLASNIMKI